MTSLTGKQKNNFDPKLLLLMKNKLYFFPCNSQQWFVRVTLAKECPAGLFTVSFGHFSGREKNAGQLIGSFKE